MRIILFLCFLCGSLFLVACSSTASDGKKAAKLKKESVEYARKKNLKKSEKTFKQAQKIIKKYKKTDKYNEFHEHYSKELYA